MIEFLKQLFARQYCVNCKHCQLDRELGCIKDQYKYSKCRKEPRYYEDSDNLSNIYPGADKKKPHDYRRCVSIRRFRWCSDYSIRD